MPPTITVLLDQPLPRIHDLLYGHFAEHLGACINGGLWVGPDSPIPHEDGLRRDVLEALRRLRVPVLRWPGGCFADDYHWMDGVGPRDQRPRTVNIWWGQDVEDNAFGTHEFITLCRKIGAEPYLGGNVGSGSPRELRDWVEYCNFRGDSTLARRRRANGAAEPFAVRYWGVGNEAWGCGGNFCPENYADEYKRYETFLRDFSDTPLFLVACGPDGDDADWTRRFFARLGGCGRIHGFAAHYYTLNRDGACGTATQFTDEQYYGLLARARRMEALIVRQRGIMDQFDPQRRVKLMIDEWGTWHPPTPGRQPLHLWQQNTLRDALAAAMTLDIFHRHADTLAMCNLAQLVNVLQAPILTEKDRLILTPTFHVLEMYNAHRGGEGRRVVFESETVGGVPILSGSASLHGNKLVLSVINAHHDSATEARLQLRGGNMRQILLRRLHGDSTQAHNDFDEPQRVRPQRHQVEAKGNEVSGLFPPASVSLLEIAL